MDSTYKPKTNKNFNFSKNRDEMSKNIGSLALQLEYGNNKIVLFLISVSCKLREVTTAEVVHPYPIKILNSDFPDKPIFFKNPSNIKAILDIKPISSNKLIKNIKSNICGKNEHIATNELKTASNIIDISILLIFTHNIIFRNLSIVLLKYELIILDNNNPTPLKVV